MSRFDCSMPAYRTLTKDPPRRHLASPLDASRLSRSTSSLQPRDDLLRHQHWWPMWKPTQTLPQLGGKLCLLLDGRVRVFPATLLQEASPTAAASTATSKFRSTNDLDNQGHVDCAANLTWGQRHRRKHKRGHDPSWTTQGRLLWPRTASSSYLLLRYYRRKLLVIKQATFFFYTKFTNQWPHPILSKKSWCPSKKRKIKTWLKGCDIQCTFFFECACKPRDLAIEKWKKTKVERKKFWPPLFTTTIFCS